MWTLANPLPLKSRLRSVSKAQRETDSVPAGRSVDVMWHKSNQGLKSGLGTSSDTPITGHFRQALAADNFVIISGTVTVLDTLTVCVK